MNTVERDLEALAEQLRAVTVAVQLGRGGAGSGVIWSGDGAIVTNAHVASRSRAEVVLSDGRRFDARIERRDPQRDLALLRIDADGLPEAAVRDPADVRVGEVLVAVGHPLGVPNAISMGIAHTTLAQEGRRFVQADLRLAPGNSGGPLADVLGRVVGINSMVVGGALALAVPADEVQRFVATREPGLLGVEVAAARLRDGRTALVVVAVDPGGRAQHSGLLVGDVLLAADPNRLRFASTIEVLRGGERIRLAIRSDTERARAA